jgi:exonuclease III
MNKQVFFIPLTTPGALGFCRNGKSSAYTYAKFVHITTTLSPPKIIVYSHTFDPTLGFTGEGPAKIANHNINGAKEKLFQVLGAALRAKIDVLLIQETHYYKTTRYHVRGVESTAKRAGWIAHHAQATISDPKAGVAVLVRADSQYVTVIDGSPPQRGLNGRLIGIECLIENERVLISSLYLPAKPENRLQILLILDIRKSRTNKNNSIVGGDFNCVNQVQRDTRSAEGTYTNLHYGKWREIAAKRGLTDIYPFLNDNARGGFTRLTATVHTRIDRIYGPTINTSWRWIEAAPDPSLFTGQAASDHLPVVVKIEGIEERPPTKAEATIKPTTPQLPNIRAAIHHIWRSVYKNYPKKSMGKQRYGQEPIKQYLPLY